MIGFSFVEILTRERFYTPKQAAVKGVIPPFAAVLLPASNDIKPEVFFIKRGSIPRKVDKSETIGLTYDGYVNVNGVIQHYYRE